jgi:hypothetical protein
VDPKANGRKREFLSALERLCERLWKHERRVLAGWVKHYTKML